MSKIAIVMGSKSDLSTVQSTIDFLKEFKIDFEVKVLSAHRTPGDLAEYVCRLDERCIKVVIAAAGGSAALAGAIAAHTILPVVGIPIEAGALKGMDSLLSTVQMPPGIPVGCMSIGSWGAKNAAIFAVEILSLSDDKLKAQLIQYKKEMADKVRNTKIDV